MTRIRFTIATLIVLGLGITNFLLVMVYDAISNDQCAWRSQGKGSQGLLITDVVPGGVTDRAGIRNGDILLEIDGIAFTSAGQAQSLINAHEGGSFATYLIEREGTTVSTQVEILKLFNIQYFSTFLLGLGFLLVGYIVVMTKPEGIIQRLFGKFGLVCMLFFGITLIPGTGFGAEPWKVALFGSAFLVGRAIAPPIFVRFFLHFPSRYAIIERGWFTAMLYTLSILLTLPFLLVGTGWLNPSILGWATLGSYTFFVAGVGIFVVSFIRLRDSGKRRQLRPVLIGLLLGIAALIYTTIVFAINPFTPFVDPTKLLPVVLFALVPFAFGYSIFRYRLMDIDLIVKRGLIYAAVTAMLAGIYLVTVYGIGNMLAYFMGTEENQVLNIVALVLIAIAFEPIKRRAQLWVDQSFYRERTNYQRALLEFSQELPRQMDMEQILNSLVNRISGTMHVEKVAVVLCDEKEGCLSVERNIPHECCQFTDGERTLLGALREIRAPLSLTFLEEETDSVVRNEKDRGHILDSGIVLAVPMFMKDRLIGTINVGPNKSGKAYSQEDIDLLSTVASQAAIAIENARLHQSEIEKQKIEEELSLARRIQNGLLPKSSPQIAGLDIAGTSISALTVGGDYYDYITISPTKLLVVVADVSGKGMSAALYMSKVQGMIQLASQLYETPREMLIHINRLLFETIERRWFITMILGLFDLEREEVRICRAGHNKAIVGMNGKLESVSTGGIALGLEAGPLFERTLEEISLPLPSDSLFVFYSDGLTETMDEMNIELGEEEVHRILASHKAEDAGMLRTSIVEAADRFRGKAQQIDDLTVVVVKKC